jgi:hypothetical protein
MGVRDEEALSQAIATITGNVTRAVPGAIIDGFELQQQVEGAVEAMAGFAITPPFGPLVVVGGGGTLVELNADRMVALAPLTEEDTRSMIARTRLGKLLSGYRNLIPATDLTKLAKLTSNLTEMAMDLEGCITACDINPILITKGTGDLCAVDALLIGA